MKLLILCLVFVTVSLAVAATSSIQIQAYTRIHNKSEITIGDVTKFSGPDKSIKEKISGVVLGDAPKLGEQRVFSSRVVASLIRKNLNLREGYLPEDLKLKIPNKVVIENRGYELTSEKVQSQLVTYWGKICKNCRFSFKSLSLPVVPKLIMGAPWKLLAIEDLPRKTFTVQVEFMPDSGLAEIFWITGQVQVLKKVPVANKSLSRGVRLAKEDVDFQFRDITFATDSSPNLSEMLGKKASRTLRANDIIWHQSIEREQAVTQGGMVKVNLGSPAWKLSLQAESTQNAYIGDQIKVKNKKSKKYFSAVVTGKGEVEVQ